MGFPQRVISRRGLNRLLTSFTGGSKVSECRTVTSSQVEEFANLTGDFNPVHSGDRAIVHGVLLNGFVSSVLGTKLPGPGYVVVRQEMTFPNPCFAGDEITVQVEVVEARKIVVCNYVCTVDLRNKIVHRGTAQLVKQRNVKV